MERSSRLTKSKTLNRIALVFAVLLVGASTASAFQRMALLSGRSASIAPGKNGTLPARCLDEHAAPPTTNSQFTQVFDARSDAVVVDTQGRTIPLQDALDQRIVSITGVSSPRSSSAYINNVRVNNLSSAPITVRVKRATVLGGANHSPLEHPINDRMLREQGDLWQQQRVLRARLEEEQRVQRVLETARPEIETFTSGADERQGLFDRFRAETEQSRTEWKNSATREEILEHFERHRNELDLFDIHGSEDELEGRLTDLRAVLPRQSSATSIEEALAELPLAVERIQRDLNLAGFQTPETGRFDQLSRDALIEFQIEHSLSPTGRVDSETQRALLRDRALAHEYIAVLSREQLSPTELELLLLERNTQNGQDSTHFMGDEFKRSLTGDLAERLAPIREALAPLGYRLSPNDPISWKSALEKFQLELNLAVTRRLDPATADEIQRLTSASRDNRILTTTEDWPGMRQVESRLESLSEFRPFDSKEDVTFFRVRRELADLIRRTFNEEIGEEIIESFPTASEDTILKVTDTRGYGLSNTIRDVVRTDELGLGMATFVGERGLAIYTPFFNPEKGTAILQLSRSEGPPQLTRVSIPTSAWDKILDVLRYRSPQARQLQTLESVIKQNLKGRDVLVVQDGNYEMDFEALTTRPVFRSVEGRPIREVMNNLRKALETKVELQNTLIVDGLPGNRREVQQLRDTGVDGSWDSVWRIPVNSLRSTLSRTNTRIATASNADVKKALLRGLFKNDNVIIMIAHSDGNTIYVPGKNGLQAISPSDLQKVQSRVRRKRPTVLLLSCYTGGRTQSTTSFGRELINAGAKLVIAPERSISVRDAELLIKSILEGEGKPLLETVLETLGKLSTGQLRFLVDRLLKNPDGATS